MIRLIRTECSFICVSAAAAATTLLCACPKLWLVWKLSDNLFLAGKLPPKKAKFETKTHFEKILEGGEGKLKF